MRRNFYKEYVIRISKTPQRNSIILKKKKKKELLLFFIRITTVK